MARSHGRISAGIWNDDQWRALTANAQRCYLLLVTQPKLNLVGCLDLMPGRWATLAGDTDAESIEDDLRDLEAAGYIIIDRDAHELVIRTFVRHDIDPGRFNRNTAKGLWSAWRGVASPLLRHAIVAHMPEFVWEKDADSIPTEAQALRSQPWPPSRSEPEPESRFEPADTTESAMPLVDSNTPTAMPLVDGPETQQTPRFEPETQSRFEPETDLRIEPPSTLYPLPSTLASLQRDVTSPAAQTGPAAAPIDQAQLLDEATELVMAARGKHTPPPGTRNPGGWIAAARKGIRAELAEALATAGSETADDLASLVIDDDPTATPEPPAPNHPLIRDQSCPDCHGTWAIDEDTAEAIPCTTCTRLPQETPT